VFLGLATGPHTNCSQRTPGVAIMLEWSVTGLRGAVVSIDLSPELLGIGALIGLPSHG